SNIGKIDGERMVALACINRVLLRAAELGWESSSLDKLEEIKGRLEGVSPCTGRGDAAARIKLSALRSATNRLNDVAVVMKTPTDFSARLPGLVSNATAVVGQVARLKNGRHQSG